jgi:molecular chaperone Hsp33
MDSHAPFIEREDHSLRAITADGSFRLIVIDATQTCQGVLAAQDPSPEVAPLLAELVTGAALLRLTMSPDQRLQAILKQNGGGNLVADAHPDGMTRGLANTPLDIPFTLGEETLLTVVRVMPSGNLHQGVVQTADTGGLSGSLTGYLLGSEQVHSVVGLGTIFDDHGLRAAAGYVVQLLPGAHLSVLQWITEHLESLPPFETLLERTGGDPELMSLEVLGEVPHRLLGRDPLHFGCTCSEERILGALGTLSQADRDQLMEDEYLSIECDYCRRTYEIESSRLEQ